MSGLKGVHGRFSGWGYPKGAVDCQPMVIKLPKPIANAIQVVKDAGVSGAELERRIVSASASVASLVDADNEVLRVVAKWKKLSAGKTGPRWQHVQQILSDLERAGLASSADDGGGASA